MGPAGRIAELKYDDFTNSNPQGVLNESSHHRRQDRRPGPLDGPGDILVVDGRIAAVQEVNPRLWRRRDLAALSDY